jgi:hypothetical protein
MVSVGRILKENFDKGTLASVQESGNCYELTSKYGKKHGSSTYHRKQNYLL